ncbi:DUF1947 domain-containing protein [Desulfurococcus mucosus]|uniref:PUA domain containing protein n=1 Tax=Desulfurococcus mucosus (strain ATCC 35584 / DSM 2162 / JCM 9187 / O7/1) TaxID=765177 RepID=E8R7A8_DESM0|nr:DUF1947 domain-containing protein [Desulfurococcus mucosus]ADV65573.1 PUA domain containing protein [Desulfurococcus mucosus DSM 2162]
MKRYPLSKKDRRLITGELQKYGVQVSDDDVLEYYSDGVNEYILVNKAPALMKHGDLWIPCLNYVSRNQLTLSLPSLLVDKGAVQAVLGGADLMVPGIVEARGGFKAGQLVAVVDAEGGRVIALGTALIDSEALKNGVRKGKAVKVLHRLGDDTCSPG